MVPTAKALRFDISSLTQLLGLFDTLFNKHVSLGAVHSAESDYPSRLFLHKNPSLNENQYTVQYLR